MGSEVSGRAAGDEDVTLFGHEIQAVGDVDGDGTDDLAVTAPLARLQDGRRGSVLIISPISERVIARLDAQANDLAFGWNIKTLKPASAGVAAALAVGCHVLLPGTAISQESIRIYSLDTSQVIATLPGISSLWIPGDADKDGTPDYLGFAPSAEHWRWISGRTFLPLEKSPIRACLRELDHDYDGDGLLDYLESPKVQSGAIVLRSTATGNRLASF
ncbi:MAG TPA: hypothetical protein VK843_12560, partial [Planctomycetota bacterium]|nr:hypothetical protein [Planctomycetota bacterium]